MWHEQFDWAHDHVEEAVVSLTFHPQVIGQAPRLRYLGRLLDEMQSRPGVTFCTFEAVVDEY